MLTAADQILWTQRIRKEEAVNGKAVGKFSVRNAITSLDVPRKFKPGHQNPWNPASSIGFHPQSNDAQELRNNLHSINAPPRGKYPWPETAAQDHGWFQKDFTTTENPAGLKTLSGLKPRVGLGWNSEDSGAPLPPYEMEVPSGPKAVRERCPFGAISPEATRAIREKAAARRAARSASSASGASSAGDKGMPIAKAMTTGPARAASMPEFARLETIAARPRPVVPDSGKDPKVGLERAMERSRHFYNRHPKSERWYKPLTNSDVAMFADAYTKSWGVQLYARKPKD